MENRIKNLGIYALKGSVPWNRQEKIFKECNVCKRKFGVTRCYLTRKFCSQECYGEYRKTLTWPNSMHIEKVKKALLGLKRGPMRQETKEKLRKINLGKKLSKETIRKSLRHRNMSSLEIKVNDVIVKNDLPYRFVGNGKFFIERKNPDFININGEKKAVEVYSRRHKEEFRGGLERWKEERLNIFKKYGWTILFIEDWQTNKEESILKILREEVD
mgnify:CR=1 FL=1